MGFRCALLDNLNTMQDNPPSCTPSHPLDKAVTCPQAHAAAAEQTRAAATEDNARLRADWAAACAERDTNISTAAELRGELSRHMDVTGKTVEVLEEEKARAVELSSRNRAQARG